MVVNLDKNLKTVVIGFNFVLVFLLIFGLIITYRELVSYNWDSTTGEVDQSEYYITQTNNIEMFKFSYSYTVNGIKYNSSNINVDGLIIYQESELIGHTTKYYSTLYPLNASVTVYYDAHNPADAALVKGISEDNFIFTLWSGTLIIAFLCSMLINIIKKNIFNLQSKIESLFVSFSIIGFCTIYIESVIGVIIYRVIF